MNLLTSPDPMHLVNQRGAKGRKQKRATPAHDPELYVESPVKKTTNQPSSPTLAVEPPTSRLRNPRQTSEPSPTAKKALRSTVKRFYPCWIEFLSTRFR